MRIRFLLIPSLLAAALAAAAPPAKPVPGAAAKKAAAARAAAVKKAEQAKALAAKKAAAAKAAAAKKAAGKPTPGKPKVAAKKPSPASLLPGEAPRPAIGKTSALPPATVFQTNSDYDPRIDLKTDFVAVHKHGSSWEEIDRAILSWKTAGYPVHRMFFIGSDAGNLYTSGKADGTPHPDEVEMNASGQPLLVGDRPYMIPTRGWLAYLKEHIRRAIDSGAEGIWPEEPLLHAAGGYSPAFKTEWQAQYGMPWQDPAGSPAAFFRASRLKSDLYLRAVDELLRYTREYAKSKGRDVKFLLPVHSPISYAGWNLVFPHTAASRLPVDGLVAQVWTGPARTPVTYEGQTGPQFFENSWMFYSYFANVMEGLPNRSLYFLADPVEDDPNYGWADYEKWYKQVLAASLLFPQAKGFEVMPWPDRIYLPGHKMGEGTPGPAPYLTQLSNLIATLKELPSTTGMEWSGGTQGIGVLTLDTMMWQRGGPQGSSMRTLQGQVLPLLKRGIPVQIVPAERVADPGYLANFKVLVLSYDMQKPLSPQLNQGIADWVRAGGTLVVLGGEDPYNQIGEWWSQNGYAGPTDHLLRLCGAGVEVPLRKVHPAGAGYTEVLKAEGPFRKLENRKLYTLPLGPHRTEGKPVYVRFTDLIPDDGWGSWVGRVRLVEGDRVRADFVAGSAGERPFLVEDRGSGADAEHRFADKDGSFVYRFSRLGPEARLELELGNQFQVSVASGADPAIKLEAAAAGLPTVNVSSAYPILTYPTSGAEPLYRTSRLEGAPAWTSACGKGAVLYCGLPAAFCADSPAGAELLRSLVRLACAKENLEYKEGPLVARRGPYVVAHSLGRTMSLKGFYVDLFKPDLPLVEDPALPYRDAAFFKQVRLLSRIPILLHGSNRVRILEASAARLQLSLDGPKDTQGVLRVFPAGMSLAGTEAVDSTGKPVPVEVFSEGRTLRVRYPQQATGLTLTMKWIRPEARLTK